MSASETLMVLLLKKKKKKTMRRRRMRMKRKGVVRSRLLEGLQKKVHHLQKRQLARKWTHLIRSMSVTSRHHPHRHHQLLQPRKSTKKEEGTSQKQWPWTTTTRKMIMMPLSLNRLWHWRLRWSSVGPRLEWLGAWRRRRAS
jgi:hypothetical protein